MNKKSGPSERTLAGQLAEHHARLTYAKIPASSRLAMKRLLLDYLGVAIAGSQTDSGRIAREFARLQGKASEATVIGGRERVPMAAASFANAISCHSIELDDIDVLALFR
jgi:2-methylcitrate dehydratase PrpD